MENQMKTITYSQVGSLSIQLDLYYPSSFPPPGEKLPALIFFHGGGMVAGCRQTLDLQHWLKDATLAQKFLFISADHRLLHPSTGHEIQSDVRTLFAFLAAPSFSTTHLPATNPLDTARLAVSGESGGVYAALTAAGVEPKPRVLLCQYGMGGELLGDGWVAEKKLEDVKSGAIKGPMGAGEVTREALREFFPSPNEPALEEVSFNPMVIPILKKKDDTTPAATPQPEKSKRQRLQLLSLLWREGTYLDYILNSPGISASLRPYPVEQRMAHIPSELQHLLPQTLLQQADFPPTVFLHGTRDVIVDIIESSKPYEVLKKKGVRTELVEVEGGGHALLDPNNMPNLIEGAVEGREKAWGFVVREMGGKA